MNPPQFLDIQTRLSALIAKIHNSRQRCTHLIERFDRYGETSDLSQELQQLLNDAFIVQESKDTLLKSYASYQTKCYLQEWENKVLKAQPDELEGLKKECEINPENLSQANSQLRNGVLRNIDWLEQLPSRLQRWRQVASQSNDYIQIQSQVAELNREVENLRMDKSPIYISIHKEARELIVKMQRRPQEVENWIRWLNRGYIEDKLTKYLDEYAEGKNFYYPQEIERFNELQQFTDQLPEGPLKEQLLAAKKQHDQERDKALALIEKAKQIGILYKEFSEPKHVLTKQDLKKLEDKAQELGSLPQLNKLATDYVSKLKRPLLSELETIFCFMLDLEHAESNYIGTAFLRIRGYKDTDPECFEVLRGSPLELDISSFEQFFRPHWETKWKALTDKLVNLYQNTDKCIDTAKEHLQKIKAIVTHFPAFLEDLKKYKAESDQPIAPLEAMDIARRPLPEYVKLLSRDHPTLEAYYQLRWNYHLKAIEQASKLEGADRQAIQAALKLLQEDISQANVTVRDEMLKKTTSLNLG